MLRTTRASQAAASTSAIALAPVRALRASLVVLSDTRAWT
eukprot:IDg11460t1